MAARKVSRQLERRGKERRVSGHDGCVKKTKRRLSGTNDSFAVFEIFGYEESRAHVRIGLPSSLGDDACARYVFGVFDACERGLRRSTARGNRGTPKARRVKEASEAEEARG